MRVPARWALVKPESMNSALVTTGGIWPSNGAEGWKDRGDMERRASPSRVLQRRMFSTESLAATR